MKKNPILSIIIPTKNNESTAAKTISSVARLELEDVEVIVQDNSETDRLKRILKDLIDTKKINYNYSNENISIINNFNFAVSASSGEYICIIGDDDGIHPEILNVVRWAKNNNIEAIVPKLKAVYHWPESSDRHRIGYLSIIPFSSRISVHKTREQLISLLNAGCLDYLNYYLPKAYHGIITRKKMEVIHSITGNYFGGLTPDIYAVTALSLLVDEVVYIDFPLTISGISPKSNSGKAVRKETNGRLEDAPHFNGHKEYSWSKNVPRIFSGETIWVDTLMHALDDMNASELKVNFDENKLYNHLWYKYKNLRGQLEDYYGGKPLNRDNLSKSLLDFIKNTAKQMPICVSAVKMYRGVTIEHNIVNVESAVSFLLNSKYSSISLRDNIANYSTIREDKGYNE